MLCSDRKETCKQTLRMMFIFVLENCDLALERPEVVAIEHVKLRAILRDNSFAVASHCMGKFQ